MITFCAFQNQLTCFKNNCYIVFINNIKKFGKFVVLKHISLNIVDLADLQFSY